MERGSAQARLGGRVSARESGAGPSTFGVGLRALGAGPGALEAGPGWVGG